jgi:hypothetical protein
MCVCVCVFVCAPMQGICALTRPVVRLLARTRMLESARDILKAKAGTRGRNHHMRMRMEWK